MCKTRRWSKIHVVCFLVPDIPCAVMCDAIFMYTEDVLVWGCIGVGLVILLGSTSSDSNVYVVGGSIHRYDAIKLIFQ